ncbi:MAG: hypothetical protein KC912_13315 [Proteobacteria bacterium]|nr:hypothetical protein [Pseudomonadota bacterium]
MSRSVSTLDEQTTLDGIELQLAQQPLAAWVFPAFGLSFASMFMLGPIGIPLFIVCFAILFGMGFVGPKAQLQIGTSRLRVKAWIGRLPVPKTIDLPVLGTTAEIRPGAVINEIQVWVLTLHNGDRRWVIPGLRCTRNELNEVEDRLLGMQELAQLAHGDGAVPEQLMAVRGRESGGS